MSTKAPPTYCPTEEIQRPSPGRMESVASAASAPIGGASGTSGVRLPCLGIECSFKIWMVSFLGGDPQNDSVPSISLGRTRSQSDPSCAAVSQRANRCRVCVCL